MTGFPTGSRRKRRHCKDRLAEMTLMYRSGATKINVVGIFCFVWGFCVSVFLSVWFFSPNKSNKEGSKEIQDLESPDVLLSKAPDAHVCGSKIPALRLS